MANPNLLSANAAEAEWHPASHTAELEEAAEQDRTLPETRARHFGKLALNFLKRGNNGAEAPPVEESAAERAERSRRKWAEIDRAEDQKTELIKRENLKIAEELEAAPAKTNSWDYGEGTPKPEAVPLKAEDWDYSESTPKPEANYRGLDPNLYTNGGTEAEKQAWVETHPDWKPEIPDWKNEQQNTVPAPERSRGSKIRRSLGFNN